MKYTSSTPLNSQEKERYSRQIMLSEWGEQGQENLKNASVLVVGAGGLGCPILQYLCSAGVGKIGIVDDDRISKSNLQRQVLFSHDEIGQYKAMIARRKLGAQNPHIQFDTIIKRLESGNALGLIKDYDLVVDGSDNFETRYLINDVCVILDKPFVHGSIHKFEGQVSVMNYQGSGTYRCLFPEPPSQSISCSEVGVIAVLPGIIGCIQANEALKILSGVGTPICNELLLFDALQMKFTSFKFKKDEEAFQIATLQDSYVLNSSQSEVLSKPVEEFFNILEDSSWQIIDVREEHEFEEYNQGGINIPLHKIPDSLEKLPKNKSILFICSEGLTSEMAGRFVFQKTNQTVYHLSGGLQKIDTLFE